MKSTATSASDVPPCRGRQVPENYPGAANSRTDVLRLKLALSQVRSGTC
jgi:hypothetical protein